MIPYPKLPEFTYIKPATAVEASQFLASHPMDARPFLGGTDLFVQMRDRAVETKYLVNVKGIPGMNDISYDTNHGLTIGAAVNMNQVIASPPVKEHYLLLSEAAQSVAGFQLRSRATIVGNICNASPAGDTIGACMLLDGVLNVHGLEGVRKEPLKTFFQGPGSTKLNPGDVVLSIEFPIPAKGMKGRYIKLGRNRLSDLAIVGVTAVGYPDDTKVSGYCFQLALASVAPVPLLVDQVEEILGEQPVDGERLSLAASAAQNACSPIDDVRGSARYRRYMVRNLSLSALRQVWQNLDGTD